MCQVFITGVLVAAFAFEVAFDAGTKQYYLGLNKGVRLLHRNSLSLPLFSLACCCAEQKTFDEVVGKFQE